MAAVFVGALWLLAAAPPLQLDYQPAPGCPDVASVSAKVRAEIGRDVFDGSAARRVVVAIRQVTGSGDPPLLVAEIEFFDLSLIHI